MITNQTGNQRKGNMETKLKFIDKIKKLKGDVKRIATVHHKKRNDYLEELSIFVNICDKIILREKKYAIHKDK